MSPLVWSFNGDRDKAREHTGEALNLLYQLKHTKETGKLSQIYSPVHTMQDGTTIRITSVFDNDKIWIESPHAVSEKEILGRLEMVFVIGYKGQNASLGKTIVQRLSPATGKVMWESEVIGNGGTIYGTSIAANTGTAYALAYENSTYTSSSFIEAKNVGTGVTKWVKTFPVTALYEQRGTLAADAGGVCYLGTYPEPGHPIGPHSVWMNRLYCLDPKGEIKWQKNMTDDGMHYVHNGIAVNKAYVFVSEWFTTVLHYDTGAEYYTTYGWAVKAYDRQNGDLKWRQTVTLPYIAPIPPATRLVNWLASAGSSAFPIYYNKGILFINGNTATSYLDWTYTRTELRKALTGELLRETHLLYHASDGMMADRVCGSPKYMLTIGSDITGYAYNRFMSGEDTKTGAILWKKSGMTWNYATSAAGNALFFLCGYNASRVAFIRGVRRATGETAWEWDNQPLSPGGGVILDYLPYSYMSDITVVEIVKEPVRTSTSR